MVRAALPSAGRRDCIGVILLSGSMTFAPAPFTKNGLRRYSTIQSTSYDCTANGTMMSNIHSHVTDVMLLDCHSSALVPVSTCTQPWAAGFNLLAAITFVICCLVAITSVICHPRGPAGPPPPPASAHMCSSTTCYLCCLGRLPSPP